MDANLFYFQITIFLAAIAILASIWKPEAAHGLIIKRIAIIIGALTLLSLMCWALYLSSEDILKQVSALNHLNFLVAQYILILAFIVTVIRGIFKIFFSRELTSTRA
ncbi:MAG: hypothetical protein Q7S59_10000 [Sulfurimonas sp.]|nr:hypothetical protein [Sulfurimonas sp.]